MFTHVKPTVRHIAPEKPQRALVGQSGLCGSGASVPERSVLGDSVHQRQQLPGGHRSQRLSD